MAAINSDSDSGSFPEEILLQQELIEASKKKSKSNSKKLPKSPDSLGKNKILKTQHTKKCLQLKKETNDLKSDSEDSEKELEIMKTALKQIKEKKAKGKTKTGSTSDTETKNDITLKLSDSTIMPLTTSTPNINSKLIQAASLSTKKGVLQKILADSNNVVKNLMKQSQANNKSNTRTKQLKGILKTSLENINNNQSDDSDSSSDKIPPSQWHSFQKKEMEESSDSEASFSNAISSTQIPQSQKSSDSDNGNKAQPVANRRQSITKNVSFDDSNLNEDNVKQSPRNKLQLKTTNDSDSDSDEKAKETNSPENNAQSSSATSSSESEDEVDTTTVTNMKQIQKNEPVKTIFENTKTASDSDSDNNSSKKFRKNNMQTGSTKSSSEGDSSESEDESSTNEVSMKPNNISTSKNDDKSSSEDERDDNEKPMNKNVVNTGAKSVSDIVSSDSDNETKAKETSSSADESSDSDSEPEMRKDVKSVAQKSKKNQSPPQKQSTSSGSSSDSDEKPQNSSKKQGNSFISQQKLDNFPQTVLQQKNIFKDISGSDNESSSDVSMNEEVELPNKASKQKKKRQREEISASESSDDEPKKKKDVSLTKRVSQLCDLSIVDTEPLLNSTNSETMYNSLKEYIITNPDLKKIDAKTNLLLEDLNEDEEVWLMQCPKVLAPNLLVGQKLKLDKNVKLKMKVGSNKYECISERSNNLNICVVASESARNQNLAAKIVKPVGTIVIHQMLKEKSPVRIETPDRIKVEAPANLKTRHPIFGANYENKIKLNDATYDKLITAELERRKAEKKALKKKRRESVSRANEKDTSINKDEIIYQLLNQKKSSINGNMIEEKKKSKKRKLSESKEENIAKVQKIDYIDKSEVDSPAKKSTKTTAEKSKKKKKEKFSDNAKSIVNESEADLSNSAGKKNRKNNKNKGEAKLEGIKANADECLTKSNETKLESILASISDTMINDTTLKKKHKKNKHKDENITMESQNASQIEKSLDNASIFEYQQNLYNGATKKSHKKNKNKNPEDPKPTTDDTVTYSKVENITEIINNFSTLSEDSTSKKKYKKKKNKDKSVNSEENSAFDDSTKLFVENVDLNVSNKSKKKHTNKNKSVSSINNEEEEMTHFTPKKNQKHVEESHDKSSELSTSITKKKSKNKRMEGGNFDKDQVINDLLSSIMQNKNGHSKDKSKKRKRESSDHIEKEIANVNEHFVEVKHKKKSKKKHDKD